MSKSLLQTEQGFLLAASVQIVFSIPSRYAIVGAAVRAVTSWELALVISEFDTLCCRTNNARPYGGVCNSKQQTTIITHPGCQQG